MKSRVKEVWLEEVPLGEYIRFVKPNKRGLRPLYRVVHTDPFREIFRIKSAKTGNVFTVNGNSIRVYRQSRPKVDSRFRRKYDYLD